MPCTISAVAVEADDVPRQAVAKNAGVDPEGSGPHRLVIHSDAGECTDPDGYVWTARVTS